MSISRAKGLTNHTEQGWERYSSTHTQPQRYNQVRGGFTLAKDGEVWTGAENLANTWQQTADNQVRRE